MLYDMGRRAGNSGPNARPLHMGNRWQTLLQQNDSREIWKAINWKGDIAMHDQGEAPSDHEFKTHFEDLLNPAEVEPLTQPDLQGFPHIPVTDDPINPQEVCDAINKSKANKSGGPSGVPPGLLKLLPINWIFYLTTLFNVIFTCGTYPSSWACSRLVTIFKKGVRYCCGNYRGISVMDCVGKIYDSVLCARIEKWFKPDREQAGAQQGCGCTEHIVTLRLLMDYALFRRIKLFVLYVDFSKSI